MKCERTELPPLPRLESGAIHLWRVQLDGDRPDLAVDVLGTDEKARVSRFRRPIDRVRFERRHVALRLLLGQYLNCAPLELEFRYGPSGKPCLAGGTDLRFSVSHSDGVALYSFVRGCEIGIDIERIRPGFDWHPVARQLFSHREYCYLLGLPEPRQLEHFFLVWTQKEAYVKARGFGLSLPLEQFQVPLITGKRQVDGHTVTSLPVGTGWAAALSVQGEAQPIRETQPGFLCS